MLKSEIILMCQGIKGFFKKKKRERKEKHFTSFLIIQDFTELKVLGKKVT